MKKIIIVLFFLFSLTSFKVYGKDFGNEEDVKISLPQFVNFKNIVVNKVIKKAEIIDKNESFSNDYITVNIYKPEINILNNIKIEKIINSKIDNIVNSFKNTVIAESERDNEFNKINGLPIRQYVVSINNTIHYNKDNILSLTLHLYSYTGGAHGSTNDISLNIDMNNGNNGVLKDFLGNNEKYDEIILDAIKKQVAENPEMYFKEEVDKITKLPYNQKFFLTEDSVVVYFDEYAIAPYVAGRPQFSIPYSSFPKGLNKIDIKEESPVIKSLTLEFSNKKNGYNHYICVPQLECYTLSNKYTNLNIEIEKSILEYVKEMEKDENIKGVTSYFTYSFKSKDEIFLVVNYMIDKNNIVSKGIINNYLIDINKNKIIPIKSYNL